MFTIRKSNARGVSNLTWLDSRHTFSFADYYDPDFMGFSDLRVINEDVVKPGKGFGQHPHNNMEIISYVFDGALEHKDSLGTGSIIRPGEIQRMSAGTGIIHSEFNHSNSAPVHFLQIWLIPESIGIQPSYEQKVINKEVNQFILIGSQEKNSSAITIHQDVNLFVAYLDKTGQVSYEFSNNRQGWLQVIKGHVCINEIMLNSGDGVAISNIQNITIAAVEESEILLFDLK